MSLMAAVDTAVRLQLAQTKPGAVQDYAKLIGAATTATPPGFGFDVQTLLEFLEQVANRLRIDTPPLKYVWPRGDTDKCLAGNLALLVRLIAADTVPE